MERQRKREASVESFVIFWRYLYSTVKAHISCHLNLPIASSVRSFCKVPMVNWAVTYPGKASSLYSFSELPRWMVMLKKGCQHGWIQITLSRTMQVHSLWSDTRLLFKTPTQLKRKCSLSVVFICGSHLSFPMKLSPSRDKSVGSTDMR